MTQLKTLETIDYACIDGDLDSYKQVFRQAAVAWFKAFERGDCHTDFAADGRNGQENIQEWIKYFFNITDEELKNE